MTKMNISVKSLRPPLDMDDIGDLIERIEELTPDARLVIRWMKGKTGNWFPAEIKEAYPDWDAKRIVLATNSLVEQGFVEFHGLLTKQ